MATNLHAMMRYQTIDRCLKKVDQIWPWKRLAEACAEMLAKEFDLDKIPSRRTIMKDIKIMRSGKLGFEAPIVYDRSSLGFKYSETGFSIYNKPIGNQELNEIKSALNILQQFSGNEMIPELQEVLIELEYSLSIQKKDDPKMIIHIDESLNILKKQWLYPLLNFIEEQKTLRMQYQSFGKEIKQYIISPYFLKKYNGRWNLIGLSHEKKEARTFPLDRIHEIQESLKEYIPNKGKDANTYFKDMIGISKYSPSQKKEKVRFKALGLNKNYMISKPIHSSQKCIEETKDYAIFELEVIVNYELEMELLARCDEVVIINPVNLRDRLKARVKKFLKINKR